MVKKILIPAAVLALAIIGFIWGYYMFFFKPGEKEITFKYDTSSYVNPLMGYAPDGRNTDLCEKASLVYAYVTWAELEEKEGEYDWGSFVKRFDLDRWRSEGKRLVFRFVCDYPTGEEHLDIPEWLYDKTGDGEYYTITYGSGYCPDYNNEIFISEHEKVIAEIGRFFETEMSGFLAYVELGSLGHWGEWHTYYPAGLPMMPGTYVREKYVAAYEKAFPDVKLLMRRPFAERPANAGVYNDMTGDVHDTAIWLNWINSGGKYDSTGEENALLPCPEIWNTAPVGGEFTSGTPMSYMLTDNLSETKELVSNSHMTFIGPKVPDVRAYPELSGPAGEVIGCLGYRYWVKSLRIKNGSAPGTKDVEVTVKNSGNAPIYYPWKMCLYVDDSGSSAGSITRYELGIDLRTLPKDAEQAVVVSLPKSLMDSKGARLYAGIEDPVSGTPAVYLTMKVERNGNLSLLWER